MSTFYRNNSQPLVNNKKLDMNALLGYFNEFSNVV